MDKATLSQKEDNVFKRAGRGFDAALGEDIWEDYRLCVPEELNGLTDDKFQEFKGRIDPSDYRFYILGAEHTGLEYQGIRYMMT